MHLLLDLALLGLALQGTLPADTSVRREHAAQTLRSALASERALEDSQFGLAALARSGETAGEQLGDSVLGRTLAGQVRDARWRGLADPSAARKRLASDLRDALNDLEFEPLFEAELPRGFPGWTAVGEIELKSYPVYRMVRADMTGPESGGAFWKLFTHIQENEIAMTAPVEMSWSAADRKATETSMAFLYASTELGGTGSDGSLEVLDVQATWAVSLGCRGDATAARVEAARAELERWVASRGDLEVVGDLRTMAYNSPMVARERRYFEVQLTVNSKPSTSGARIVIDFSDAREAARWQPLDDRVMGGVSVSRLEGTSNGSSLFTGVMSLESNGGFASVRAPLPEAGSGAGQTALAGARELVLSVRGDGKVYKLRLRTENDFDGVNYEARFQTEDGVRTEHVFAIADFSPVWRGRPVANAAPLDPAQVRNLGLLISDGQAGRFSLELYTLAAR